ncbi:MAG: PD-(D/E)XK nuclease family protein [Anaerolineaceae bacterium]|nr:PD-(D/E)XK nuclease family protein [Anaerolineaceae bacterium]
MNLPSDFQFSQSNLQDFMDCQRRFQLRYIMNLKWPALQCEPVLDQEYYLELGYRFHRFVHQHQMGIPSGKIMNQIKDPTLEIWWESYLESEMLKDLPSKRFPEITFSGTIAGSRLIAKLDLLVISQDSLITIFDWKTSRRRTPRNIISKRMQTHLYPFLNVEAGQNITGGRKVTPEMVKMIYWFPNFPNDPEIFEYDEDTYHEDHDVFLDMIEEIRSKSDDSFSLTRDEKMCRNCTYRSLCNRGIQAGKWHETDNAIDDFQLNLADSDFDFDQIGEIYF